MTLQYRGIKEDFRERLEDVDSKGRIIRAPETSIFVLRPGDLVQFNYYTETRIGTYQGLVVSTKRSGSRGYRLTKDANTILQVVTVESLNDEVLGFVVNNLYKNRILSRYLSIKNRMNATDKRINYSYLKNLGRVDTELTEQIKESTMARRALGRENRAGLVSTLEQGRFKTFRVEKITDVYSISLLDPGVS